MEVIEFKKKLDLSDIKNIKETDENKQEDQPIEDIPPFDPNIFNMPLTPITPILSPEETKEKRKMIIHIKNYIKTFPDSLEEFKNMDLSYKTIPELNNLMEEIKLTVCNSNNGDLFLGLFHGGCDLLESVGPIVKYDLTGLKFIATKNENVIKCVKEISLEYQQLNYIRPEKRLLMLMLTLCYGVNNMNKINNNINNHLNKDIDNKISDKYNDL
jgi:hypothetical protein